MPRLLLFTMVFFALGVWIAGLWPADWHPGWLLVADGLVMMLFFGLRRNRFERFHLPALLVLAMLTGSFYTAGREWRSVPELTSYLEQEVGLRGRVAEEPVWKNGTWHLRLQLSAYQVRGGAWLAVADERALLKIRAPEQRTGRVELPRYGDSVQIDKVRLEQPSPARNPGAFDARKYYLHQGIAYLLTVKQDGGKWRVIAHDDRGFVGRLFLPLQRKMLSVLEALFPAEQSAVLAGLLLGIVDEIDPDLMESFRLLGVAHILAVSGANVALLLMPFLYLTKHLKWSLGKRYGLAILLVLLYAGITAGGPSVWRASTMAIIWCLGQVIARESDGMTSWALAGSVALLYDPQVVYDVGFQLTMLVTAALFLLPPRLLPLFRILPSKFANLFALTLAAELTSVPLILTINPTFTPLSLLANLYVVPLLTLLVPLSLCVLLLGLLHPAIAYLPSLSCRLLLDLLIQPLSYVGGTRWWVQHIAPPSPLWLCGYYGAWLLFVVRKWQSGSVARWYAKWRVWTLGALVSMLLAVLCWHRLDFGQHPLRVTFLDVGQGDSILIEMPHGTVWLVDGGGIPSYMKSDFDIGERIVVPALASRGIDEIDVLVMTHADEDHVRGLEAVLRQFTVRQVLVSAMAAETGKEEAQNSFYQGLMEEVRRQGIPVYQITAGQALLPETGVNVAFWNPPAVQKFSGTRSDSNANSIVFSLQYGQRRFLFTGDLEGEAEADLGQLPSVDVLKVAHHGSRFSSTATFLQNVAPSVAVISAGINNRYGHPARDTLDRLRDVGAQVWRTDQQGAIVCETNGENLLVYSWVERDGAFR